MIQQVEAKIQVFAEQVSSIYMHPLHYTYIMHKNDSLLHLYDVATMDIVGKTKVMVLDQMKHFAFTNEFNTFYGLRQSRFLVFQLNISGWLAHMFIQTSQQIKPYLQSYYLCFYSPIQRLICVTPTNFYFVSPRTGKYVTGPDLKYKQIQIYPHKVVQITGLLWIIGYKNSIYLLKLDQNLVSYEICDSIEVGTIVCIASDHNPKKQFAYVINDQKEILLIKIYDKIDKIQICYKFFNQNYIPLYLTLLRPGINTSTTDKLKNRLYISVYCEQKSQKIFQENQKQQMIDQNDPNKNVIKKNFHLFIVPTETQLMIEKNQNQYSQTFNLQLHEDSFLVKNMPQVKNSPWINVLSENCLFFLTTKNQVCFINFTDIKQLKLTAQQWVCMGYRFELLSKNQVYQQKQEEFQDSLEKEEKPITKEFLDDWSQSIIQKDTIYKKLYNRIKAFDIY